MDFDLWYGESTANDDVNLLVKEFKEKGLVKPSEGAEVIFKVAGTDETLKVYTTRPDTLFGASFIGISSNHPLAEEIAKNNK